MEGNKTQNIEIQIIKIRNTQNIKPTDILRASPFDKDKDLNGLLTEDIFFDRLFYENGAFTNAKLKLLGNLQSKDWTNRVIFYNGFSGIGKTTFLRSFIHDHNDIFNNYYFDVHKHVKRIKKGRIQNEEAIANCFSNFFLEYVKKNGQDFELFHYFIKNHRALYRDTSNALKISLDNYEPTYDKDKFIDFLFSLPLDEVIYVFFTFLFKNRTNDKLTILYFDNLDAVEIEYLSSEFKKNFPIYLQNINEISREEGFNFSNNIDFINNYKFIFCLRDANFAQVEAPSEHQHDDIFPNVISDDFKLHFDDDLYKNIIQKRINFITEVINNSILQGTIFASKNVASFFNEIVIQDEIFHTIALPLYNYDNRKLVINLYQVAEDKDVIDIDFKQFYNNNKHGARGSIIYGLLKLNFATNFLKKFYDNIIPIQLPDGYCDPRRMILTTLSNIGSYDTYNHSSDYHIEKEVGLFDFITIMIKIYSLDTIIKVLVQLYLDYQSSWTHLITIRHKAIISKNSFDDEKSLYLQLKALAEKYNATEEETKRMRQIRETLNKVKLKINPSAFSFLRHIIIHFEYFSILGKNTEPLFKNLVEISDNPKYKFNFEEKIDNTYSTVERYFKLIYQFYKKRIEYAINLKPENFIASDYCFKFFGGDEIARRTGMFYTLRVLTAHVGYIEIFRCWILEKSKYTKEIRKEVNSRIIFYLEKYLKLINEDPDPQSSIFYEIFRTEINKMKKYDGYNLDDCK